MTRLASHWYKLLKMGQAHLAPGMNLVKWESIIYDYLPRGARNFDALSPNQIDEIIRRISAEVNQAKSPKKEN